MGKSWRICYEIITWILTVWFDVGTKVDRTLGPDIGYNRIELTLSGGVNYCFIGGEFKLSNALAIGLDQMGT